MGPAVNLDIPDVHSESVFSPDLQVSFSDLLSGFLCLYAQIIADFKHWGSGPLPSNHNQSIHEDGNAKISL
jgi:hypothetical protein